MNGFYLNLIAGLISGGAIFLVGLFLPKIPKSIRKYKLRKFWGNGVLGQEFVIAYGALKVSRHHEQDSGRFWYHKIYSDGSLLSITGPRRYIVSDCEVRSSSYIINTLSTYRKEAVPVQDDAAAFPYLNRTFVAFGSPSSNEISRLILKESENKFLEFVQEDIDTVYIRDKKNNKKFPGPKSSLSKDYGILVKIPNTRFKGRFFFVCAGLGEWGTSGASWYLANKWNNLRKEFGDAFGIIVEVDKGSDESARRVFPSVEMENNSDST